MTAAQISTDQMRSLWQKHQKNLNRFVVILLIIYLIAFLAEIFWRMMPAPEQVQTVDVPTSVLNNASDKPQINLNGIKNLLLFGDATEVMVEEAPVVQEAPETNLNLTLTGLVASTTVADGAAIIENKGAQNTYGIGEKVDGTRAIVKEVMPDRIIIDNGGKFETLMLDGHDFAAAGAQPMKTVQPIEKSDVKNKDRRNFSKNAAVKLDQERANMAQTLRSSPAKFTDFISIQPYRQQGKIAGYKVNPGREPALFKAAGLKSNDVLTEINGLDLTDVQQSMEAMNMLRTAESLQITLSRGGEITTLDLELPAPNGN